MLLRIGLVFVVASTHVLAQRAGSTAPAASPAASTAPATGPAAGAARDPGSDVLIKALEVQKWYTQLGDIA